MQHGGTVEGTPDNEEMIEEGHGTALDRVSAFQTGFIDGVTACARIDLDSIEASRGDLPMMLNPDDNGDTETGEAPIDQALVTSVVDALNPLFSTGQPPTVSVQPAAQQCPDVTATAPVSCCPSTNTITVDLAALQTLGSQAGTKERVSSKATTPRSRFSPRATCSLCNSSAAYLSSSATALRTACLTGVAQRKMVEPVPLPSGGSVVLTAGDFDEAVAGLLNNGLAASDVNGNTVAPGLTALHE